MLSRQTPLLLATLAALCLTCHTRAELQLQPTPFSVSLDLRSLSNNTPYPIWLQGVDSSTSADGKSTLLRLRLRKVGALSEELLLRLFFEDLPNQSPRVSTWNELGDKLFESKPLGSALGLPSSEQILLKTADTAFIEIEVPGNGSNLRSLFVSSLRNSSLKHAWDFEPGTLADPFGGTGRLETSPADRYLYGRIQATLDDAPPLKIPAYGEPVGYEFELSAQPILALLTFEVLNPDVTSPPALSCNDQKLGEVTLALPDLADPGFQASMSTTGPHHFRYTGWVRCQKLLPASALRTGANTLLLMAPMGGGNIAIRSVVIQLKYPWSSAAPTSIP